MYMIKILLIFSFFILSLNADYIHWYGDYDKALQIAQKEKKPLMVLLVKHQCPSCNNVIKNYFSHQKYITLLNQKYIAVIVTYESEASYPIEMFYSTTFPSLFFVDSQTETFLTKPLYGDMIHESTIKVVLD